MEGFHAADADNGTLQNTPEDLVAAVKLVGQFTEMFTIVLEIGIQQHQRNNVFFIITIHIIFPQAQNQITLFGFNKDGKRIGHLKLIIASYPGSSLPKRCPIKAAMLSILKLGLDKLFLSFGLLKPGPSKLFLSSRYKSTMRLTKEEGSKNSLSCSGRKGKA